MMKHRNLRAPRHRFCLSDDASQRTVEDSELSSVKEGGSSFGSVLGSAIACLGGAVGTGNIWRFPRILATQSYSKGSLTFYIVWIILLFLWSVPVVLVEYAVGRFTKNSPLPAFQKFVGKRFIWLGAWLVGTLFLISVYYPVIVGWCLYYIYQSIVLKELPGDEPTSAQLFNSFAQESYWPVFCQVLTVLITGVFLFGGIRLVEKANLVMVPLLLLILIFTFGWSMTRQYAEVGMAFLLTPAWGECTGWVPDRIPVLFSKVGIIGRVLSVLFFLSLYFAGISSLLGDIHVCILVIKEFGVSYRIAVGVSLLACGLCGLPSAIWLQVLENQDDTWAYALIVSGFLLSLLVTVYGPLRFRHVVINEFGTDDWKVPILWVPIITVLVPLEAGFLIGWWIYGAIASDPNWYQINFTSVLTTLVEWLILLIFLVAVNMICVRIKGDLYVKTRELGADPYDPSTYEDLNRNEMDAIWLSTDEDNSLKAVS
ncbi:unnamed protein product [Dicrocoelium dendriticum]|nr:unnamed protein product [Dicrocoelium dendriticum]